MRKFGDPRPQRINHSKQTKPLDLEAWLVKWDVHLSQTSLEELKEIMRDEQNS